MYLAHFGLREPPFSITPDPRFLYMSGRHREALAHLIYGVGEHGGFVQLTGEVGTGKTSVCRCLLEQLPAHVDLALVFNPRLSPVELLATRVRRAAHRVPRRHDQPEGARRPAPSAPPGGAHRRPPHGPHHRRGAEPRARGARGGPAPDEPRDRPGEAAPGDPDRPAGAGGDPRAAEAPAARPARHGSLSSRAALAAGDARVHPPPARGGRPGPRGLHGSGACGRCTAARVASPASSTPSPTAPCWAPTRASAPRWTPRPCGARRPRCWARRRLPGAAGCEAPPRRPSSPPSARSDSCSSRRARSARSDVGRETSVSSVSSPSLTGGPSMLASAPAAPVRPRRRASRGRAPGSRRPGHEGRRPGRPARAVGRAGWRDAQPDCERALPRGARVSRVGRHLAEAPSTGSAGGARARRSGRRATLRRPHGADAVRGDASLWRPRRDRAPAGGRAILERRVRAPLAPAARRASGPAGRAWDPRPTGSGSGWGAPTRGQPAEPGLPYDQALWERVTAFQQARSLEPDGVVGRETAIVLRRAEWGPEVPRLSAGAR